jgi:hypothetical protein
MRESLVEDMPIPKKSQEKFPLFFLAFRRYVSNINKKRLSRI